MVQADFCLSFSNLHRFANNIDIEFGRFAIGL